MSSVSTIEARGIYSDLLRKFRNEGNSVYIVYPRERRTGLKTELYEQNGVHILGVRTLNLKKTNIVEKGLGQLLLESQFKRAIRSHFSNVFFDLILYSTPPVTFTKVVSLLKHGNPKAVAYLLLKDIFPQNAVDLGLLSKRGLKGVLYHYFRYKEKRLYELSDFIGCMSPANMEYLISHNPNVEKKKVEIAPNSIELSPNNYALANDDRGIIRKEYGLPWDKPIFIYGGNLGKPQGIDYLIDCLSDNSTRDDCYFVIVGNGTDYEKLEKWYSNNNHPSVLLLDSLPKEKYDRLVSACDVGLIFLDHRFTIPNYPSRLLSYLEQRMPILAATDCNTDIGRIAEVNGYGYWCESDTVENFTTIINRMIHSDIKMMGQKGYDFLCKWYLVDNTYQAIVRHVQELS